jgi:hypothetical protein
MVLREAAIAGEVERGRVPMLTGYEDRAARMVTAALIDKGMLTSTSHRAPLRRAFPTEVAERWLPQLYPSGISQ